jgi:hypothetical protein
VLDWPEGDNDGVNDDHSRSWIASQMAGEPSRSSSSSSPSPEKLLEALMKEFD